MAASAAEELRFPTGQPRGLHLRSGRLQPPEESMEQPGRMSRAGFVPPHNPVRAAIISYLMMHSPALQSIVSSMQGFFLLCSTLPALGQHELARLSPPGGSSTEPPVIVIGFVGGFVKHDNLVHSGVQLAARLRSDYASGVHIEVFENRRGEKAHEEIIKLLDTNHDATLSSEEKQDARIILYGMSWGASEAVTLARQLEKDGIPVLLTLQVDSITKIGENDELIPANVSEAANFYQPSGALHGRRKIRAADETRTRILGNFRFDYKLRPVRCDKYPWYDRVFAKFHTEIECDPAVWNQVETLIRSKLPPVKPNSLPKGSTQ